MEYSVGKGRSSLFDMLPLAIFYPRSKQESLKSILLRREVKKAYLKILTFAGLISPQLHPTTQRLVLPPGTRHPIAQF